MAIREPGNLTIGPNNEGKLTNPIDGALVADSGVMPQDGTYEVRAVVGASADAILTFQRRNAANGANVGDTVTIYVPGTATGQWIFHMNAVTSERFRLVMDGASTGTLCGTLWAERLS